MLRPRLIARPERRCRRSELPKVGLPQCPSEKKGQTAPLARVTSLLSSPCTRRARRNRGPPRPQPWNSLQRQTPRWRERDSNRRSRLRGRRAFRYRLDRVFGTSPAARKAESFGEEPRVRIAFCSAGGSVSAVNPVAVEQGIGDVAVERVHRAKPVARSPYRGRSNPPSSSRSRRPRE